MESPFSIIGRLIPPPTARPPRRGLLGGSRTDVRPPRAIDAAAAAAALLRKHRAAKILGDAEGMEAVRGQLRTRWLHACREHRHGEARAYHMAYLRTGE